MKIALIGYGKMGRAIEQMALGRGHTVVLRTNSTTAATDLTPASLQKADVAIEFTRPNAALTNITRCFAAGVPVVVGTTGWYEQLAQVTAACAAAKGGLFAASYFSIGVQLFFALNKHLAALMNAHTEYDVMMREIHHLQKLDAPSGTAITLAEGILENLDRKAKWVNMEAAHPTELSIESERMDAVPGTHIVTYTSPIDSIELTHTAYSRLGFAQGAVLAAEFMVAQKGKSGVYGMGDLLKL